MKILHILCATLMAVAFVSCDEHLSKPQHYPKNTVFYSVNHSVIG